MLFFIALVVFIDVSLWDFCLLFIIHLNILFLVHACSFSVKCWEAGEAVKEMVNAGKVQRSLCPALCSPINNLLTSVG